MATTFRKLFCFSEVTGKQQYEHPEFRKIMESLEEYDGIKYNAYRVAFKIYALQKHLRGRQPVDVFVTIYS